MHLCAAPCIVIVQLGKNDSAHSLAHITEEHMALSSVLSGFSVQFGFLTLLLVVCGVCVCVCVCVVCVCLCVCVYIYI